MGGLVCLTTCTRLTYRFTSNVAIAIRRLSSFLRTRSTCPASDEYDAHSRLTVGRRTDGHPNLCTIQYKVQDDTRNDLTVTIDG